MSHVAVENALGLDQQVSCKESTRVVADLSWLMAQR